MFDHAKRHLVGATQQLEEVGSEVFPKEMEADDVQEIQEDGHAVGNNVDDVNEALKPFPVNDSRGKTIEKDGQQIDAEDNGQVETHPIDIECQGLSQVELVEKLDVEQIEHPAADTECQQGGQQSVDQQHVGRRKPILKLLFSRLTAHRFVAKNRCKNRKKAVSLPKIHITKYQT